MLALSFSDTPDHTQVVVSHDKTADAAAAPAAAEGSNLGSPVTDIIAVRAAHDEWFAGAYARSNSELYGLLAKCLDAYQRMRGKRPQLEAFRAECTNAGFKFKKTTGLLGRVVRYVFGADRRRVSAYARVLEVVVKEDPHFDPAKLHIWIADRGGIEEVRTGGAKGLTAKQKMEANVAIATSAATAATPFTVIEGAQLDMTEATTTFVAALARTTHDGSVEVIGFVTDEAVIKAVLAAYGKQVTIKGDADDRMADADAKAEALAAAIAA